MLLPRSLGHRGSLSASGFTLWMGVMMAFGGQSVRRFLTAGAFAAATLAAPAVILMSGTSVDSAPQPLADCSGIPVGLEGLGAYTTN